jgi:L-lactate dehydrogenase complex protein LldG
VPVALWVPGEQGQQVLWACVADAGADATAVAVAVAETSAVVLDGSGQGRRVVSLLPDRHVCVVRPDQVVGTVPEALAG